MSREDDVNALIKSVLECCIDFYDNPNGGFVYTCPLCGESKEVSGENMFNIQTFPHDVNCGYLIAKGLATNLKLTDDRRMAEGPVIHMHLKDGTAIEC